MSSTTLIRDSDIVVGDDAVHERDESTAVGTQEDFHERARDIKRSMRWAHRMLWLDILVYTVFLTTFLLSALAPFVSIAWDGYQFINLFTKHVSQIEWPNQSNTFEDIHSSTDFWSWWKGPFRAVTFGLDPYYDGPDDEQQRPDHVPGYILNNFVVGTVRLRQQRVRASADCRDANRFTQALPPSLCYGTGGSAGPLSREDWDWPRFYNATGRLPPEHDCEQHDGQNPVPLFPSGNVANETAAAPAAALGGAVRRLQAAGQWSPERRPGQAQGQRLVGPRRRFVGPRQGRQGAEGAGATARHHSIPGHDTASRHPLTRSDAQVAAVRRRDRRRGPPPRFAHAPRPLRHRSAAPATAAPLHDLRSLLQSAPDEAPRPVSALDDYGGAVSDKLNQASRCKNPDVARPAAVVASEQEATLKKTPAYLYRNDEQLSQARYGSATSLRIFKGDGFAHDFDVKDLAAFDDVTELLYDTAWIDGATRVVMVELTLYSAATDITCAAVFIMEIYSSGYAASYLTYEAFRLSIYRNSFLGYGRAVVDVLFILLCTGIFIADAVSAYTQRNNAAQQRSPPWRNPFYYMSFIMFCMACAVMGLRIENVIALQGFDPHNIADASDAFGSDFARLHGPSARLQIERSLMAVLSFFVWLRVFKYTQRLPVFGTIGRTIMRAFPAIVLFLGASVVVFCGFAQAFYLGFYNTNDGFQTFPESLMSMLRFVASDVDYFALRRSNTVLAPVLYTMGLFVLVFVWSSMLLAIIINAYYDEVKQENVFEFDPVFPDFRIGGPLVTSHKEYDHAAMVGADGTMPLTPEHYNRFIVDSLARFDTDKQPMFSLPMQMFLDGTRYVSKTHGADGRTAELSPRAATRLRAFNESIIIRLGYRKKVRKVLEVQALYFPIEMDEHQARAWWEEHKHLLRVGDAAYKFVKKNAPRQVGKFLYYMPNQAVKAGQRALPARMTRLPGGRDALHLHTGQSGHEQGSGQSSSPENCYSPPPLDERYVAAASGRRSSGTLPRLRLGKRRRNKGPRSKRVGSGNEGSSELSSMSDSGLSPVVAPAPAPPARALARAFPSFGSGRSSTGARSSTPNAARGFFGRAWSWGRQSEAKAAAAAAPDASPAAPAAPTDGPHLRELGMVSIPEATEPVTATVTAPQSSSGGGAAARGSEGQYDAPRRTRSSWANGGWDAAPAPAAPWPGVPPASAPVQPLPLPGLPYRDLEDGPLAADGAAWRAPRTSAAPAPVAGTGSGGAWAPGEGPSTSASTSSSGGAVPMGE